ncbi:S-adenosylmethionine decarboxylase related protein [Acidilobus saccharovorans 345-15]|uniref:Arginine decarboxylase proenzyme n=1 Tax=Acidilobus saccharovorans (strain DSM 16705 / JCM 18335 / VKM B-2471 / 345-15) TaxID=666510 RepID=D9Q257_ACIS3|nr:adenosylmethionine decarboxylase [Acidilobus saccharovorans]ADL19395.1 S-adenosylmethionine decarboxylase related protein [Acidilobus saccharovorans 345-15]
MSSSPSTEVSRDYIVGKHVFGSLYGIPPEIAEDENLVRQAVLDAVKAANATLIEIMSWKIGGHKGGVSVIALVNESHIVVHTWTEYRYATVDAYTCGEHTKPEKAFEVIVERLKPEYYTYNYADRTQFPASSPVTIVRKRESKSIAITP